MAVRHGGLWKSGETRMSNIHLSILRTMGIEQEIFTDSTGTVSESTFSKV